MNRERLLKVAQATREHPDPLAFSMHQYAAGGVPRCPLACYAARPDLQTEFKLLPGYREGEFNHCESVGWVTTGRPVESSDTFCGELLIHFDIDQERARQLFGFNGCGRARTAWAAAQYIESFAAQGC